MLASVALGLLVSQSVTSVVLVTDDPKSVPVMFFTPTVFERIDRGDESLRIGGTEYQVVRSDELILIIDPETLSVRQVLELTALAEAVAKAPRRGLVTALGDKAVAALERKLPENLLENFWPGDKIPGTLRYEIAVNVDFYLTQDERNIRFSISPEDPGGREDPSFRATALKYKGPQDASSRIINYPLNASFVLLRSMESNPGAFAALVEKSAPMLARYVQELELRYSQALYKALTPYSSLLNAVAPKGPTTRRVSDLAQEQSQALRSNFLDRMKQRGFADETDVERFLTLADVTFKPSLTLQMPIQLRDGQVMIFGYNLAMPKGR